MTEEFDPSQHVLFIGLGKSAVCWYRCALPALFLGADWLGSYGAPPRVSLQTGLVRRETRLPTEQEWRDYRVVVVQQPHGDGWCKAISEWQAIGTKVLFEVDDYLHAIPDKQDHDFRESFTPEYLAEIEQAMRLCDGVICSTPFIANHYRPFNRRLWVCENGLDTARYNLTRPPRPSVNIGWAGATAHRDAIVPWLQVVAQVMHEHPETCFVSIGQGFANAFLEFDEFKGRAIATPFTSIETYPAAMTMFDIAIAPGWNGRGSLFTRGKSDLRFLEAGALGIPLIGDRKVYRHIEDGITGFLADTPADLYGYLKTLVTDPDLRTAVGQNAKEYVKTRDIRVAVNQWLQVFSEVQEN